MKAALVLGDDEMKAALALWGVTSGFLLAAAAVHMESLLDT